MMPGRWSIAWVTGASSGIGRELALALARRGVRVAASARSQDKLAELARMEPNITPVPLDVTRLVDVRAAHEQIVRSIGPVDLAILNAGIWLPMKAREFDAGQIARSFEVNVLGIANALEPLIPAMAAARRGHLALVSSVAGYRGLPRAAAYAPGKAAVISLAEVLRLELQQHGVTVSLVNPGFVDTPMTAVNDFPMPFMIKSHDAAARILRGLERGKYEIVFPWQLTWQMKLLRLLPNQLFFRIAGRIKVE